MTPRPIPIKVGDFFALRGKPTPFIVRELLPDGKHAVCERTARAGPEAFFAGSGITSAKYILALEDLEKR